MIPPKLEPGDTIRFVSPASTPDRDYIAECALFLESLGLVVEIGQHAFDKTGYLAGKDEHRLSDLNDALRDPTIKAVMATRGGKGAYRIAGGIDFDAVRANPKIVIGFSDICILHFALHKHCGLTTIHGASWVESFSRIATQSLRKALFTTDPIALAGNQRAPTASLTTSGRAEGVLLGGNQDTIAAGAGWCLPRFRDSILLLEGVNQGLGAIDRQLTMLVNAGHFDGVRGVAVGQYVDCGRGQEDAVIDVLRDRFARMSVPILGGLPIGHGDDPNAIPLGTQAVLDADNGTLTVAPGVR